MHFEMKSENKTNEARWNQRRIDTTLLQSRVAKKNRRNVGLTSQEGTQWRTMPL